MEAQTLLSHQRRVNPAGTKAHPPGFMSARETSSHADGGTAAGFTTVDGVPYKWKMVGGKLEMEKIPVKPSTAGTGSASLPKVMGGVDLPKGAVVPRASPMGGSPGRDRPEALGKHVLSLPQLAEYTPGNPTALGDWIVTIQPMLSSLTDERVECGGSVCVTEPIKHTRNG